MATKKLQIIGSLGGGDGVLTIDTTDAEAGTANLINADTVGGLAADSFALKSTVESDYALKTDYVKKSGDTMSGNLIIRCSSLYPAIDFRSEQQAANDVACMIDANLKDDERRIAFSHWHQTMDGADTRYRECYLLPDATSGLTKDKYYNILTTKDLSAVYPVGSIYMSVNSTSPASLFGGTWEQLKDRFLLGAGNTYSNGATGGAATVTLTISQIPSHSHTLPSRSVYSSGGNYIAVCNEANATNSYVTGSNGGSKAHNNMPPYLTVYMWKRVS